MVTESCWPEMEISGQRSTRNGKSVKNIRMTQNIYSLLNIFFHSGRYEATS